MNKKYKIQEFIDNKNLVILCDTLDKCKKVGKYLWKGGKFFSDNWQPLTIELPFICWYSKDSSSFNPASSKYKEQIIINFEDVLFGDEFVLPEKWSVKITENNYKFLQEIRGPKLHEAFGWYITSRTDDAKKFVELGFGICTSNLYGTEITLEQFCKYVLKKEFIEDYSALIKLLNKLNIK
jgi:hypothetical protein